MLCEQVVILMGMVDGVGRYEGVRPQVEPGWGWHVFYICIQVLNLRTG